MRISSSHVKVWEAKKRDKYLMVGQPEVSRVLVDNVQINNKWISRESINGRITSRAGGHRETNRAGEVLNQVAMAFVSGFANQIPRGHLLFKSKWLSKSTLSSRWPREVIEI